MPGRILTLQTQARELGRLRTGYTQTGSNGRGRPVKSQTWIVTGHAHHYIEAAAAAWGGTAERWSPLGGGAEQWRVITGTDTLDAVLPAGDPLSQAYELWSGGGCARRCNGVTETKSGKPCLCLAQHGELWHEQPKGKVCATTTRLNVFLPEMPDVGVFRVETHSYWAAAEIAAGIDLIRAATGGGQPLPIRLRIEQRQRKADGQTKNYPVIVVELRGITTGHVLAGAVGGAELAAPSQRAALDAARSARPVEEPQQRAIEAAPARQPERAAAPEPAGQATDGAALDVESVRAALLAVDNIADLNALSGDARAAGLTSLMAQQARKLSGNGGGKAAPKPAPAVTAGDADALWQQIVCTVPDTWTSMDVERDFWEATGVEAEQATAGHMRRYLEQLPDRVKATS